jgi:hypothetical protein
MFVDSFDTIFHLLSNFHVPALFQSGVQNRLMSSRVVMIYSNVVDTFTSALNSLYVVTSAITHIAERSMSPIRRPELPGEVLVLIGKYAINDGTTSVLDLLTVNSTWHKACSSIIYGHLAIPPCHALLETAASRDTRKASSGSVIWMPRLSAKLRAIHANEVYASAVTALYVVEATSKKDYNTDSREHLEEVPSSSASPSNNAPHYDSSCVRFGNVLCALLETYLPNLRHVTWALTHPVSREFLTTLRSACPSITRIDFLATSSQEARHREYNNALERSTNLATRPMSLLTRWDASLFACFALERLHTVTLQSLSAEGVKNIALVCPALVSCDTFEIQDTVFVDDVLLVAIGMHLTKLKRLRITRMAGTKVTSKGIAALMENSFSLEELALVDFEGKHSLTEHKLIIEKCVTLRRSTCQKNLGGDSHLPTRLSSPNNGVRRSQ